jgi:maltooligosyltrehalose synthase
VSVAGEQLSTAMLDYGKCQPSYFNSTSQPGSSNASAYPPDRQYYQRSVNHFAMRFQQYTSALMAKGLEDTSFYRYNRLISLNEVGGDPLRFGITPEEFHRKMEHVAQVWPNEMITTSTHDSKHSEDVRARINVLLRCR